MRVVPVPLLEDNYAYLLIDEHTRQAAIVDPAQAAPVLEAEQKEGVELRTILNTHHHWDHTGGNLELIAAKNGRLLVAGSGPDSAQIPGITERVSDGDRVAVGELEGRVLFIPCHTRGHVAYLFGRALFCGDTLFAAGCGRFFEGTAEQMYHALHEVLGVLPDDTLVYCGHEYTEKNLRFAMTLEPSNAAIREKLAEVIELRSRGLPSIPTTLGEERTYNPFLRTDSPELIARALPGQPAGVPPDPIAVLTAVRAMKDRFHG